MTFALCKNGPITSYLKFWAVYLINILISKRQSTQLSQTRAAHQKNLKKQRVDQEIIEDNYNTSNNKASLSWYWHNIFNKNYFDLDKELVDKIQEEKEKKEFIKLGSQFSIMEPAVLQWDVEVKTKFCGI